MTVSLKRVDCTGGEGRSRNPLCWKAGLDESYVQPQAHGLWKCRPGSRRGSLARLPTCCLCSVQQPLLILPTCAGGAGAPGHWWVSVFPGIPHSVVALWKLLASVDAGLEQSPTGQ